MVNCTRGETQAIKDLPDHPYQPQTEMSLQIFKISSSKVLQDLIIMLAKPAINALNKPIKCLKIMRSIMVFNCAVEEATCQCNFNLS